MKYLFKVLAVLLGLFAVAATVAGWYKVGGLPLIVLVPGVAALAWYLWKRVD